MERIKLEISARLAVELREWAEDLQEGWPKETVFQRDLADLLQQLDRHSKAIMGAR